MPNVLFVTPFIWEAGPWRGKPTVHNIIRGFQRAGYEVHVVTCTNKPQPAAQIWEGVHLHYFRLPFSPAGFEFDAFHSFLTQVSQAASPWRRHLTFRWLWLQFVWFGWRRRLKWPSSGRRPSPTVSTTRASRSRIGWGAGLVCRTSRALWGAPSCNGWIRPCDFLWLGLTSFLHSSCLLKP